MQARIEFLLMISLQEAGGELGEEAEAQGREELAQEPEEEQDEYWAQRSSLKERSFLFHENCF